MKTLRKSLSCRNKTHRRRRAYKKRRNGGAPPIKPSPVRKGYSASTGRIDDFIIEDLDELSTLEKCQRQYRLLKFGYDANEKKNAYLTNELEKLKRKHS
jgi:hypothetical protein